METPCVEAILHVCFVNFDLSSALCIKWANCSLQSVVRPHFEHNSWDR